MQLRSLAVQTVESPVAEIAGREVTMWEQDLVGARSMGRWEEAKKKLGNCRAHEKLSRQAIYTVYNVNRRGGRIDDIISGSGRTK
jgi:hypothetical protein